jgi:hypothetical protein
LLGSEQELLKIIRRFNHQRHNSIENAYILLDSGAVGGGAFG